MLVTINADWRLEIVYRTFLPYSTDTACGQGSGGDGGALLHETAHRKPETVAQRILVNEKATAPLQAGVRVVPFIRC